MSFARGGADPRAVEALRREIVQTAITADAAMEVDHWQLGIRERRAFPPGHEAMIDARKLFMSPDGRQIVWLIRGGRLINQSGYQANLKEYDVAALLKIRGVLQEMIEPDTYNPLPYRSPHPLPPSPPRRRGLWERVCDWLGI